MAINPIIKQKAEDIRKKIFGTEVRESLASGIEAISEDVEATIGRQDYVEEQFQDVLDETTGKDVISAPELIAARNGKSNLKTRLDDEHAQVTAQLQQTEQNLNAQLARTDTKVNAMASGTPKIVVQSVSQLPPIGGTEKLALVLDDGHKYYDNGTAWIDAGAYQATKISNKTIDPKKISHFSLLVDNLNTSTFELGKLKYETGETVVATDAVRTSTFIKVDPATTLTIISNNNNAMDSVYIYEYDVNKEFIKHGGKFTHRYTTSAQCEYIKTQSQTRGSGGYILPDPQDLDILVTTKPLTNYPTDYTLENLKLLEVESAKTDVKGVSHSTLKKRIDEVEVLADRALRKKVVMTKGSILANGANQTAGLPYPNEFPDLKNRARTRDIIHVGKGSKITLNNKDYNYIIHFYMNNSIESFIELSGSKQGDYIFAEDAYIRFVFRRNDGGDFNIEDMKTVATFNFLDPNDKPYLDLGVKISFIGEDPNKEVVTHGDGSLVQFPNGEVMGIDFHHPSNYEWIRNEYKSRGIERLDYIVVSHYHSDHVGCLHELVRSGTVKVDEKTKVFLPQPLVETSDMIKGNVNLATYNDILTILESKGVQIIYPTELETHTIAGCDVVFWNTDHTDYYGTTANYNDLSLCLYIFCGNYNVCFTGDLGPYGQEKMAGKLYKTNVYKAQHHGWDNGADNLIPAYINNVSPDVVFTTDGKNLDQYIDGAGHPLQTWCERNNVSNYRTRINNTMDVVLNDKGYRILTPVTEYIRNGKNWVYTDNL